MRHRVDSIKLGEDLRSAMAERNFTQEKIGVELRLQQGHISNIFRGKFKTANSAVQKICKYVDMDWKAYLLRKSYGKGNIPAEALNALATVCRGSKTRGKAIARILIALEDI